MSRVVRDVGLVMAGVATALALILVPSATAGPGMGWGQWTSPDLTFGECTTRAPKALRAEGLTTVEQYGRVWFGASSGAVSATVVCYGLVKGALVTIFAANEGNSGPSGSLVGKLVDRMFTTEEPTGVTKPGTPVPTQPSTTTNSAAAPGTFASAPVPKIANPRAAELTIDAANHTAVWDHCCDGGKWKVEFSWTVPTVLVPGKSYRVALGMKIVETGSTPNGYQIGAYAPDFHQDFSYTATGPTALMTKSYDVPLGAGYATDPNFKDIVVTIGFVGATVSYTYHRAKA